MVRDRINIYKIAEEAGVSPATVSRVITNNARVSEEKRQRVEAVINKYDYKPNALAQGLSTARTHTIGLLIADIASPFYANLAKACEQAASSRGYMLLILSSLGDNELEKKHLIKMCEQQVDAIIIAGGRIDHVSAGDDYIELVNRINASIPVVATGHPAGAQCCQVSIDEGGSMDMAMNYLFYLGHKDIAFIGGGSWAQSTYDKIMHYKSMLWKKGVTQNQDFIIENGDYSGEGGYNGMKEILGREKKPTAVVAVNDYTASGVIRAIHEAGMRVPEDISVIAFDNTFVCKAVTPNLTSIACDYEYFAATMIDTAIAALNGTPHQERQVIPVKLTIRDSCVQI